MDNWKREFRKWLGNERIGVFVANGKDKKITNFTMGKAYNVMIIGYEMLRVVQEDLKKGSGVDIVIADEGHRLKTATNKTMLAIQSLNTERAHHFVGYALAERPGRVLYRHRFCQSWSTRTTLRIQAYF